MFKVITCWHSGLVSESHQEFKFCHSEQSEESHKEIAMYFVLTMTTKK